MTAAERVRAAYAAIDAADRPEVWIFLRPKADALADADVVDAAVADGAELPLAGLVAAVKNNVAVKGLPTTAACPSYATTPASVDATAVARLREAGAVVLGATNLDQFATGLVGTRSPHGAVRDSRRPEFISGGSSSGSAVAVALGLVDVAIGTDTAGSGRVPAAFQGIVGIKPTVGVVPVDGVVPACRSYDCVTVFARDVDTADVAMGVMAGGATARPFPPDAPLAAPEAPVVAIPRELPELSPAWREAFGSACARLAKHGVTLKEISLQPFLEAARLLYDGGLVAERHEAVGSFVDAHRDDVDPTVGAIVAAAGEVSATRLLHDRARLVELTAAALAELGDCDAMLIPTTTAHPSIAEVAADPVAVNSRLGTYTNFCNLMDLCAVAVPSGKAGDDQFGVTVVARSGADAVALDVARLVIAPNGFGGGSRRGGRRACVGTLADACRSVGNPAAGGRRAPARTTARMAVDRPRRPVGGPRVRPRRCTGWSDSTPPHRSRDSCGSGRKTALRSAASCGWSAPRCWATSSPRCPRRWRWAG